MSGDIEKAHIIIHKYLSLSSYFNMPEGTAMFGDEYKYHEGQRLTVLIPCWGKAKYIKDTVSSVLNNTLLPDSIIILLMDDDSIALKEDLAAMSSIIDCIEHERLDVASARNYLATLADSEWLMFLDADDQLYPDYFETLLKGEKPNSINAAVRFSARDQLDIKTGEYIPLSSRVPRQQILGRKLNCSGTVLMHSDVMKDYQFNPELDSICEDTVFIFNIMYDKKYSVYWHNVPKYLYLCNTENSLCNREDFYKVVDRNNLKYILPRLYKYAKKLPSCIMPLSLIHKTQKRLGLDSADRKPIIQVTFSLNRNCNKNCIYCNQLKADNIDEGTLYENFDRYLTMAEEAYGTIFPQLLGGEPTLLSYETQIKILERLREYPIIRLFTNGYDKDAPLYRHPNVIKIVHATTLEQAAELLKDTEYPDIVAYVVIDDRLQETEEWLAANKELVKRKLQLIPCMNTDNASWNFGERKLTKLADIIEKYHLVYYMEWSGIEHIIKGEFEDARKQCHNRLFAPQIDCITGKVLPCCNYAVPLINIDEFDFSNPSKYVNKYTCADCCALSNFGNEYLENNIKDVLEDE